MGAFKLGPFNHGAFEQYGPLGFVKAEVPTTVRWMVIWVERQFIE
jgi:hypothetical protein